MPPSPVEESISAHRRRLTLVVMCISQGMIVLDITIVNTALPSIQRELHMTPGQLEWVISAYALSLAAFIPLGGALGDRYGRKRLFLAGMVVFALGSAACALSSTDLELILSRGLQGVGGAVMAALTLSILSETYPPARRAGAIGIWAAVAGLGFGLGPVIGGILLSFTGWSAIFWVNVPVAVVGFILAVVAVPESRNPDARHLDVVGVVAVAIGLFAVTFGLIESSSKSWGSGLVIGPLVGGVVVLVAFLAWELRSPAPMLPRSLLRARSFVSGSSVYLLTYLALTGVLFYVTLLFQNVDGWSPLRTGVSWLSMNVPFLAAAQFAGRLNRRFSSAVVVSSGCLVGAVGVVILAVLNTSTPFAVAFVGYVLLGAGWGVLVPGTINIAMRDVPLGVTGAASGILNAARQLGTSVGLAVLGVIGVRVATSHWLTHVATLPPSVRSTAAGQAQAVAGGQIGPVVHAVGEAARSSASASFVAGYRVAMVVGAICTLLAAVVAYVGLRERPPRSAVVGGADTIEPARGTPTAVE